MLPSFQEQLFLWLLMGSVVGSLVESLEGSSIATLAALLSLHGWRLPTKGQASSCSLGASLSLNLRFADEPGRQLDILEAS